MASAKAWQRLATEGDAAYRAFLAYRDLGGSRSHASVSAEHGTDKAQVARWSSEFEWVARCRAWDDHLVAAADAATVAERKRWAERRQAARESAWLDAQTLREKVTSMLKLPLTTIVKEDDGKTITIEPARWTLRDAALMMKLAHDLEAAALEAAEAEEAATEALEAEGDIRPHVAGAMIAAGLAASGHDRDREDDHGPF